jgi:predicted DsbA family dithiol-disulfide isomerase
MTMAENIRFYFDPLCPWCYQTSRWARRLDELGVVDVEWRVFSLAIVNSGDEGRAAADTGSAPSLRTAIAVRNAHGNAAVGAFYKALSDARHQRGLPLEDHAVIEESLREASVEPALLRQALADPSTWEAVQREHDEAVAAYKAFGVPTIVLDGGDGPQMFGPIISDIPDDEGSVELWQHFVWMARNRNVAEMKRDRLPLDLESIRLWRREREQRDQRKQAQSAA